ncbi:MAG: sulfotransferase [Firmicutes bacterium]|nr:sulfotransferase [Bacillota bacterium]
MPLPDFLCVGTVKGGTTTLHDILKQHPDIYLPIIKETRFFDESFEKGVSFYERSFRGYKGQKLIGEIAPTYMYPPYVAERIYKTLGKDIKIIFMLRDPADRAFSHYLMAKTLGLEKEDFPTAVNLALEGVGSFRDYIVRGYYANQIINYLNFFPKENMLFIIFEDFIKDVRKEMEKIYDFLDVEQDHRVNFNIKSNQARKIKSTWLHGIYRQPWLDIVRTSTPYSIRTRIRKVLEKAIFEPVTAKLDVTMRIKLINIYRSEIDVLEKVIQKDLSHWKHVDNE